MPTIELASAGARLERPRPPHHGFRMADAFTWLRIALLLPLWWAALSGRTVLLGIGLLITASTDVVDGILARRQGPSKPGSQLDSVADLLMTTSTVAWLVLLRPDVIREHAPLLFVWAAAAAFGLAVGWIRFRRVGNLHLYSAKVAGVLAYLLVIALFLGWHPAPAVIDAVLVICIVATAEIVLVLCTRAHVDEHVGSILRLRDPTRPPERGGGMRRGAERIAETETE